MAPTTKADFKCQLETLPYLKGVNMAGAEFGKGNRYGHDYIYPARAHIKNYDMPEKLNLHTVLILFVCRLNGNVFNRI